MKKLYIFLLLFTVYFSLSAQSFEWVKYMRTYAHFSNGNRMATDRSGNIYICGEFKNLQTIDGDTLRTPSLYNDFSLSKFSPSGSLLWNKQFGSCYMDAVRQMAVDDAGHIYVSIGQIQCDSLTFEDTTVLIPYGSYQLLQFDSDGKYLRHHIYPGGRTIHVATLGNDVYTTHDHIVTKHDTLFNTQWTRAMNVTNLFALSWYGQDGDLFVSRTGRLVMTGLGLDFGTVQIDTLSITFNGGFNDVGLLVMDTSGSALWARVLPATNAHPITSYACAADDNGNVYWGTQMGDLLFFGNDTLINPSISYYSALLKYDASGNEQWAVSLNPNNAPPALHDIVITSQQDVVVGGEYSAYSAVGTFAGFPLPSANNSHIISRLDASGNVAWIKTHNEFSQGSARAHALGVLPGDKIAVAGQSHDPVKFGCFTSPLEHSNWAAVINENPEPVPATDFSATQSGSTVLFKNATANASSIQWNFGDGTTSTLPEPLHTYTQAGVYSACLTAVNSCGSKQKCDTVVVNGVRAIITNHGSNDGVITADVFGGGFTSNTTVLLKKTGSADIVPYYTRFINAGQLEVRLDLTAKPVGLWNVEVTVPGDTVMTLVNGFRVDTASGYDIDITHTGPAVARPGRFIASHITIHNKSDKDMAGVTVFYRHDKSWIDFLPASFIAPQQNAFLNTGYQYLVSNSLSTSLTDHTFGDTLTASNYGAFIIPLLKANSSFTLPNYIKGTISISAPRIAAVAGPMLESSSLAGNYVPTPNNCFGPHLKNAIEKSLSIAITDIQWIACFPALNDSMRRMVNTIANDSSMRNMPVSLPATLVSMLSGMASSGCISGIPAVLSESQIKGIILKTLKNIVDTTEFKEHMAACPEMSSVRAVPETPLDEFQMGSAQFTALATACVFSGFTFAVYLIECPPIAIGFSFGWTLSCIIFNASCDPNRISGPGNNEDDIYQKPGDVSSYTVAFENVDTATAPAQVVTIRDTLDLSRFDKSTFRFTSVIIGDSLKFNFTEPGFSQVKVSSLAPLNSDYLRTEATFDTATGIIEWTFTTVEPVNFQPDTNALAGFLPPNLNGTEGTGYVSYDIQLKQSLVTGDSIINRASIAFDNNAPIITNEWVNVIDITDPQSEVNALPANTTSTSFVVSWSGSDFVSGILSYAVYVSKDDQPYELWIPATDTTQATFDGVVGSKYEFISIAEDRAGNVEDAPADPDINPDAVTTLVTGIEEIGDLKNVLLYPNPFTAHTTLEATVNTSSEVNIRVSDPLGRIIHQKDMTFSPGFNTVDINTSNWAGGIYQLRLTTGEKRWLRKLVKE